MAKIFSRLFISGQHLIIFRPSFAASRFASSRAVSDRRVGDGFVQVADQSETLGLADFRLVQMRLPVAQGLQTALEADRPNRQTRLLGRLEHQVANAVVGDEVHQDFFADHVRCLAAQDIHSHGRFDIAEEQLNIPALQVEIGQVSSRILDGVQQGGHEVELSGPKPWIGDCDLDLPQG